MSGDSTRDAVSWTAEFVSDRLSKLADMVRPKPRSAETGQLHQAAAVLAHFDPSALSSIAASPNTDDTIEQVLRDSTVVYEHGTPKSMLRASTRRAALEQLGNVAAIRRVLQSITDRPRTALQRMIDGYVLGKPKLLDLQNLEELAASLQVSQWFSGLLDTLPDPRDLERRIEREALLKPFRDLAGTGFAGREEELSTLRTYVGFLEAASGLEVAKRGYRWLVTGYKPLVIHAPGGMGKSTLVARFILDHLEPTQLYPALPFVYLDFDRPVLLPERFSTLLDEAARQLSITFAADRKTDQPPVDGWSRARGPERDIGTLVADFAGLIRRFGLQDRPLLFVLDTFEEVQYRSRDVAEALLEAFGRLQNALPILRVVVVGRAPVSSTRVAVENEALGPLTASAAATFLQERSIDDPAMARRVANQVGGNPLSLRLVLELVGKDQAALGASGVTDLTTRNRFYIRLSDNQIQGQLFRRILSHVSSDDVRNLAHPGLVLRRVTPELILEVLAGPCGVNVPDIARAQRLFEEMAREVSLVSVNADGSLQHLPEVRSIMLDLLKQDRPVQVQDIQERAVTFYRDATTPIARAELVYHLLMLRRDRSDLEAAWQPGLERFLRTALAEVPPSSRPFLAARLGEDIDKSLLPNLQLPDQEIRIAKRVRDLLTVQKIADALQLVKEGPTERTPGSVLYLPESQAYALSGDWKTAYDVIARAFSEAARFDDPATLLKMEVMRAWIERALKQPASASLAADASQVASRFDGEPLVMRVMLHRLALATDERTRAALRPAVAGFFERVAPIRRDQYSMLCWEVAGTVGQERSDVLFAVLTGGLPEIASLKHGRALSTALAKWDQDEGGRIGWKDMPESIRLSGPEITHLLLSARTLYETPPEVLQALIDVYAEAAEQWRTDQHLYDELERPNLSSGRNLAV